MLEYILWGIFIVALVIYLLYRDSKKMKHQCPGPPREKTEQEKETEIAIAKEKSRIPPMGGGR